MTRVVLDVVTMVGSHYVLYVREGGPVFPSGDLVDGEQPAEGARRLVREWTGTKQPKLELVDLRAAPGELRLIFRAMLTDDPQGKTVRAGRMELPARVGALAGRDVEEALKTSLAYKLTRG